MKKIFISLILLILVFGFGSIKAQIAGEGLTISPPILELTLKPGETSNQIIKITNPTEKIVEVYPVVMNFSAKGETGEPTFTAAADEESKFALAKWIKFNQTKLALTPEQVVEFNYQIEAPLGAEPGGHYGVVFFATEPPKAKGDVSQVSIASMIGSLILVKVPGNIIEKGFLEEFSANRFYFKPPVNFVTRVSNLGNVHFKPKGEIMIKDFWGNKKENLIVNESKGNVLPDSTRRFDNKWPAPGFWTIGKFSANLKLIYGESEKTLDSKIVFWLIPWWLIIALIVIIILVIILIIWLRRRRGRRKKAVPPLVQPSPPAPGLDNRRPILR